MGIASVIHHIAISMVIAAIRWAAAGIASDGTKIIIAVKPAIPRKNPPKLRIKGSFDLNLYICEGLPSNIDQQVKKYNRYIELCTL